MKKIIPAFMIFISVLMFISLILITIYEDELPDIMKIIGFTTIGYLSLIIFTIGVFKIGKSKNKVKQLK